MENYEHSGDSISSSIVTAALGSTSSVLFLTPVTEQEQQNATTPTEMENPAMGSTATTESNVDTAGLHPAVIIGIPVVLLLVLLILLIIFIVRCRNQKQTQQDELGSENGKSPIFEEDTPSVMEIEMEELDKWMNSLKRNEECDFLPPVKEEKDCNTNPSFLQPSACQIYRKYTPQFSATMVNVLSTVVQTQLVLLLAMTVGEESHVQHDNLEDVVPINYYTTLTYTVMTLIANLEIKKKLREIKEEKQK